MIFYCTIKFHSYICTRLTRTMSSSEAAGVVKLVDTPDLGSGAFGRVSSSLIRRTFLLLGDSPGIDCLLSYWLISSVLCNKLKPYINNPL